jgi:iron complex outermembrane recepter protein
MISAYTKSFLVTLLILTVTFAETFAQQGIVHGTISDSKERKGLAGITIHLEGTHYSAVTGKGGTFQLHVPPGKYKLRATRVGYQPVIKEIKVSQDVEISVSFPMYRQILRLSGVEVTALPVDIEPTTQLSPDKIREINFQDAGELLRNLEGVDAVRRGPIGLDPSIRGLRESEVGFYVDGTRMFPGGPARMDSPLSHYDPDDITSVEVVKGPYALTAGPGNLSAVQVRLAGPPPPSQDGLLHGEAGAGYSTNIDATKLHAALLGRKGKMGYRVDGNWHQGGDYKSGNGTQVPAHFHSEELRSELAYDFTKNSALNLGAGYQYQHDIDYPGRLLYAKFYYTYQLNANYVLNRPGKILRKVEAQGYFNHIRHQMNNDGEPTAFPNPNRMPPFPLYIVVNAYSHTSGGKLAFTLRPDSSWKIELGGNFFSNYRKAIREIDRRDTDVHIFTDLAWPGATVTMGGIYANARHSFNKTYTITGTLRADQVVNTADTASQFFLQNVTTDLQANHFCLSGDLVLNVSPVKHWNFYLGVGTAARSADASELYSDRFPSTKAQTSAEFMGNPQLKPERSYQSDFWIEGAYPKVSVSFDVFARRLDNYVTIIPTNLPKRLPLSPDTVFAYRNGTADFYGFEFSAAFQVFPRMRLDEGISWLWGRDITQNEPALGVSPFRTDTRARYELENHRLFLQAGLHTAATQNRVASSRGETPTPGYYTISMSAGGNITPDLSAEAGVENLTNQQYSNHLNSKDPYTGIPVPEPGRIFYAEMRFNF